MSYRAYSERVTVTAVSQHSAEETESCSDASSTLEPAPSSEMFGHCTVQHALPGAIVDLYKSLWGALYREFFVYLVP